MQISDAGNINGLSSDVTMVVIDGNINMSIVLVRKDDIKQNNMVNTAKWYIYVGDDLFLFVIRC